MNLRNIVGVLVAATAFVAAVRPAPLSAADDKEKVTIVGCAGKGNGDGDGFLLANNTQQTTQTTVTPTPSGPAVSSTTTREMTSSRVLYWLDDDDGVVEGLMGQLVEITGEVEGDLKRGEIQIERENGMIELEINADGRKATVKLADVPSAVGTSGSVKDDEVELKYLVRKLDVKSARSLAATCR